MGKVLATLISMQLHIGNVVKLPKSDCFARLLTFFELQRRNGSEAPTASALAYNTLIILSSALNQTFGILIER